jgi:hypothetical protein
MVGILLQRIHGLEFGVENDIAGIVHATNVDSDLRDVADPGFGRACPQICA